MRSLPGIFALFLAFSLSYSSLAGEKSVPLAAKDRIVFLGDSITQAGAGPKGYVTLIRSILTERHPGLEIDVIGAGISGNKVPDLQRRLQKDVIDKKPTIVVIYIGINDVWHGEKDPARGTMPEAFESGLKDVIGRCQEAGARVVLCTPTVIGEKHDGSNNLDEKLDAYADISRGVAKELKLPLCDLRKEFVAYLKKNNSKNEERGILTTDRVHLNEAGNVFVAETMLATLDPLPVPRTVADGAELVHEFGDDRFFEGPVWDPKSGKLYFTAFAKENTQILRLDGTDLAHVWLDKTEGVNGMYLSKSGTMLGAQAYGNRVMEYTISADGPSESKALVHDATLFQPNDVAEAPNGDIYFTDPDFQKREGSAVFLLSSDGTTKKIIVDMPVPNGVIVSNDGKSLYVGDSHEKLWRVYPIQSDGTVGPGHVFFDPATDRKDSPDGMSIDAEGNLYLSGRGGVWVADPFGTSLGLIAIPEFCSNVTFGGVDGKTLYLTCSKKVYSLRMKVRGAQFGE